MVGYRWNWTSTVNSGDIFFFVCSTKRQISWLIKLKIVDHWSTRIQPGGRGLQWALDWLKLNIIKTLGFYPQIQIMCYRDLGFKDKLNSRVRKPNYPTWPSGGYFESDITENPQLQTTCTWNVKFEQTGVMLRKPCHESRNEKFNMATRRPFWKRQCWKWTGFYQYTQVVCYRSLELTFKAKLKLESGHQTIQHGCQFAVFIVTFLKINSLLPIHTSAMSCWRWDLIFKTKIKLEPGKQVVTYGRQVIILKVTSLKINRLLPTATNHMHIKFETEVPKQTRVMLRKPCHLQSSETKKQFGRQAAILKMTSLHIARRLPKYPNVVQLKFGVGIQSQTKVWVRKQKKNIWSPVGHFENDVTDNR